MAFGILHFSKRDFLELTPYELLLAHKGYRIDRKEQWEMIRFESFVMAKTMGGFKGDYSRWKTPNDPLESSKGKKRAKIRKL